jgi:hypothetical protein
MHWEPQHILQADRAYQTATDTVRVTTDAGPGFLKALGNHGGPHLLAADWIGTKLAAWLGLPTFETAIIEVTDLDEIHFLNGSLAQPGPAFIAREMSGETWGAVKGRLTMLVNPGDVGKLMLFDTWTRNADRYPPDLTTRKPNYNNLFFSNAGLPDDHWRLIAMDHTHCFTSGRDLDGKLSRIDVVKDERVYGLFPELLPYLVQPDAMNEWNAAVDKLGTLDRAWVRQQIATLPPEWQVEAAGRAALEEFICERANFLLRRYRIMIHPHLNLPQEP